MAGSQRKNGMRPHSGLFILIGVCGFLMLVSSLSSGFNNALRSGADSFLMPMQRGMNRIGSYFFEKLEEIRDLRTVRSDNSVLKEELAVLREENARLKEQNRELEELQELLEMAEQYPDYDTVGAHIIGKNSGNWYQSFLIDKGTRDGLALDMNVLADGGLVGIITAIGEDYATVSSIINDGQYVSAMSTRTGDRFLVAGDLTLYDSARIGLESIRNTATVAAGDTVVTSNISEKYLPGLLIGTVDTVTESASRLEKTGTLIPAADFDRLDSVLVITTLKETGDAS